MAPALFSSATRIILEYASTLHSLSRSPQVNLTEIDHEYEHGRISEVEKEEAYRIAAQQIQGVRELERRFVRHIRWRWWGYRKFWEQLGPQLDQALRTADKGSFREALITDLIRLKEELDGAGKYYYSPWFWQTWYTEVYQPSITPPPAPDP